MEASKLRARWEDEGLMSLYLGEERRIIDIGCGEDLVVPHAAGWDRAQGDAVFMHGAERGAYDTVFSSHCLEHLLHPEIALGNWASLLKPGGYLVLYVPHRDLYEHKQLLPSHFNPDHKFFILPEQDEAPHTWSLRGLISRGAPELEILWIRACSVGWTPPLSPEVHSGGEYSIEALCRRSK